MRSARPSHPLPLAGLVLATAWIVGCGSTTPSGFGSSADGAAPEGPAPSLALEGGSTSSLAPPSQTGGASSLVPPTEAGPREPATPLGTPADAASGRADASTRTAPSPTADAALPPAMAGCATESLVAQPTPLDVLFLLDTSSSMSDLVAPAESKWSAVTGAVARFVEDPSSAGMQVAFEFFPVSQPGVPRSCASNDACGAAGPCMLAACDDGSGTICATDHDCALGSSCVPTGVCSADPQYLCSLGSPGGPSFAGLPCGPDPNGFDLGTCNAIGASTCLGGDDCASTDYATPPLPFASLPAAASAVESALGATQLAGATPTVAALSGAITAAQARAAAMPDHTVVLVLATDGVPDEGAGGSGAACVDMDTATANAQADALAAAAYGASPSVSTYAIGVFTPDAASSGSSALDGIAAAGGTGEAYVVGAVDVDGGASVEDAFAQALNQIRRASLPCRFDVPTPGSGVADPSRVNVAFTPSSGATATVPRVAAASACGASAGWYFDPPAAGSSIPTTLSVCPGTCSSLRADAGGRVDVVLGCEAVER